MMNLRSEIDVLEKIAREAAQFMLSGVDKSHTEKTNAKDYATVADIRTDSKSYTTSTPV